MNENDKDIKKLGDIVVDLVSKGRLAKLETAFRNNPELMKHVRGFSEAHTRYEAAHKNLMDVMSKICKKKSCEIDN